MRTALLGAVSVTRDRSAVKIAVVGGGIQGCLAAIELETRGHDVVLFERHPQLVSGASRWNEGKIHLGYLFANDPSLRTARRMLDGATSFAPLLTTYLERDLAFVPLSSGFLYAVHRESLVSGEQVRAHIDAVHGLIKDALAQPGRHYLGHDNLPWPSALRPEQAGLDSFEVASVISTGERSIDSGSLLDAIAQRVTDAVHITVVLESQVVRVMRRSQQQFRLVDSTGAAHGPFGSVVNATWEGRLALDQMLGYEPPRPWIHRFKLALQGIGARSWSSLPSVTVVLGQFGDLVTFENGQMYLSWYPVGRIASSLEIEPPSMDTRVEEARHNGVPMQIALQLGSVIPELRRFDPELAGFELNGGYIFAWGKSDISDINSRLHTRYEIGVQSDRGYHSINTGKLTMAPLNASILGRRIDGEK